MTPSTACRKLVDEFRARPTLRSGSLITTVFGDAVAPRGGTVWLGSLIKVMAGFGVSERLVRTSAFRLVQDGWLKSKQIGRRSYYSLTAEGRERFDQATHRIYAARSSQWNGEWTLLLTAALDAKSREALRRECRWLGFGNLAADVLAHPSPQPGDLNLTLQRLGVSESVVVLSSATLGGDAAMRQLTRDCWQLDDLDERYQAFVERFRPVHRALAGKRQLPDKSSFIVRTLLIQEYRKVLLRDPWLPAELLPSGWHGGTAYQLCRNLYRGLYAQADAYVESAMETAEGPLPPPSRDYSRRFGGLPARSLPTPEIAFNE